MTAPERIWAGRYHGTWWQSTPHHQMTEYIRADVVQALVAEAMKRALYATRDRTWSGVEALISDPAALSTIGEGGSENA